MANRLPGLGDKVRCRITGFEGIAVTHATHLTGCDRLWIEPPVGADGSKREGAWFDIDMIDIVKPMVVERVTYAVVAPGGRDLPASR